MILEHFLLSVNETNSYVLGCGDSSEAVIIDPGEWNDHLSQFLSEHGLKLTAALITHGHYDHTGGVEALKGALKISLAGHSSLDFIDRALGDGDMVNVGSLKIKVLETPGHTGDSLTFVIGCDIFCGDLLFAGSVGGVPDQDSYFQELRSIREKIFPLGDDMVIHPGHGAATTVLIERLFNPFLID